MRVRILVILSLCAGLKLLGAEKTAPSVQGFTVDASRSTVEFTLGAVLHTVHGRFTVKSGMVRFDAVTGRASGRIVVDLRSGNTGVKERDQHMHEEVLESERFPEAIFTPDRVTGQISSEGQVLVHGILQIHGQDHEITVPATVNTHDRQVSGSVNFVVPYVKWGMKDPSTFVLRVKDTVDVTVKLVGTAS